ncbi:MAG: S41 family peptidase [Raineya sp.]|jgi:hypothetical protein|nr:S41 family peptidase [Raineya sp.]
MKLSGSFLILMLFCLLNVLQAQNSKAPCKCEQDFQYTTNYIENHYSGFQDNVTDANREQYNKLKQDILADIQAHQIPDMVCLAFMKRYVEFFRDNHLQVWGGGMEVDENKPESIAKFKESDVFKNRERIQYDSVSVYQYLAKSQDPIEGVYKTSVYEFAVLKNQNSLRDYYAVMIRSTTPLWEKGQVKLDLKRLKENEFQSILYMRNHSLNIQNITSELPIFDIFREVQKTFPKQESKETTKQNFSVAPEGEWFQFKALNDSTHYVHIKTFNGALQTKFDSVYKQIIPIIKTKPYLIIDIRDNGGGSDNNWKPLAQLAYTTPYEYDKTYVFCTTETIKRYEELLERMEKNRKDYGDDMIKWGKERVNLMKKAPLNSFVPTGKYKGKNKYRKQKNIEPTPKKIVLMYNRNSGSAAEGIILDAMHSKKVITFGENSGGYITFGNVMVISTPQLNLSLQTATQKTPNRFKYEKTGIPPQVKANNDSDWLIQALDLLKTK